MCQICAICGLSMLSYTLHPCINISTYPPCKTMQFYLRYRGHYVIAARPCRGTAQPCRSLPFGTSRGWPRGRRQSWRARAGRGRPVLLRSAHQPPVRLLAGRGSGADAPQARHQMPLPRRRAFTADANQHTKKTADHVSLR